jgi:hypothetical protein
MAGSCSQYTDYIPRVTNKDSLRRIQIREHCLGINGIPHNSGFNCTKVRDQYKPGSNELQSPTVVCGTITPATRAVLLLYYTCTKQCSILEFTNSSRGLNGHYCYRPQETHTDHPLSLFPPTTLPSARRRSGKKEKQLWSNAPT